MHCLADVAITPLSSSIDAIEDAMVICLPLLQASGLDFVQHSGGFTIDAEWKIATEMIGKLHELLHENGFVRVHSDIRIGTRTDKAQTMQDKVDTVIKKMSSV